MFEVLSGCNVIGHGIFGSMASNSEPPQSPNYDNIEMEGIGSLTLPNSLKAPFEKFELSGNSKQGHIINISSDELEQGLLGVNNGLNYPSNYRVRTKDFITLEKGKYKVICDGAKQGQVVFYSADGAYKNSLFDAHTVFPFYFTVDEVCKIRVVVSNGTETEAIVIKPENVKSITVETEASPEYPQEIVSAGKYDETSGKYLLDVEVKKYEKVSLEKGSLQWGSGEEIVHNGTRSDFVDISGMNKNFVFLVSPKHTLAMNLFFYTENKKYMNVVSIQPYKYYEKCSQYSYRNTPDGARYIRVSLNMYTYNENNEILIEEGSQSQTVQLKLDRPLTKWDKIEKRDGVYGIVYKHRTVDDLATLVKDSEPIYGNLGGRYFSVPVKDATLNYDYSKVHSECGLYKKEVQRLYVPKIMLSSFIIHVNDTDTIETAKEHLHYKVIYETDSEEFVPLSEETQLALENLHANDGTTTITVDSGEVETGIKLTYRKEK